MVKTPKIIDDKNLTTLIKINFYPKNDKYFMLQHGYQAVGFEISKLRAAYGRKNLQVHIIDDPKYLTTLPSKSFDVIFTNHVIEHLPRLRETFDLFGRLLTDEGLCFFILPNFTGKEARKGKFWSWIGRDHPLAPTADFFKNILPNHGFRRIVIGSGPFDQKLIDVIRKKNWEHLDAEGDELLVIAWKK